ncbi:MAG: hypothetical protein ABIF01_02915, partial [Candidatus Micrarchaeota archaeon]
MEKMDFIRNPYLVLGYCLLFVFLSSFTMRLNPAMYIVIFILIAITTFIIRPLKESYLKPTCYFLIGTLSYWIIARELVVSQGGAEPAIVILFGLAVLNGLVALITYSDSETSGQAFIAGALALLFLNLPSHYTFLSGVLVFAASSATVYFIFKITEKSKLKEEVIKASIVSSLFLYAASLSHFWTGVSVGVYSLPSAFVFGSSIIYVIALSAFSIWVSLTVFELFLSRFGYVRSVSGEVVTYSRVGMPISEPASKKGKAGKTR